MLYKDAAADVRVRVRRRVVVHVEQPVILVLTIVTANVQTRVGRVEVPVIREPKSKIIDCCAKSPNLGKRNKVKIQLAVSKLANEWVDIEKEGLRPPAKIRTVNRQGDYAP